MLFQTSRLTVKELSNEDIDLFYLLHNDTEVMNLIPAPIFNLEESQTELKNLINSYQEINCRLLVYGVYNGINQDFIGTCAIIKTDSNKREIGYRLLKKHWKQGFGTELTAGLIEHLKLDTSVDILHATADKDNIASQMILSKFMAYIEDEFDPATDRYECLFQLNITR